MPTPADYLAEAILNHIPGDDAGRLAHAAALEIIEYLATDFPISHEMERGYFMAEIPKFKSKASANERHRQNKKKMVSRFRGIFAAALIASKTQ